MLPLSGHPELGLGDNICYFGLMGRKRVGFQRLLSIALEMHSIILDPRKSIRGEASVASEEDSVRS